MYMVGAERLAAEQIAHKPLGSCVAFQQGRGWAVADELPAGYCGKYYAAGKPDAPMHMDDTKALFLAAVAEAVAVAETGSAGDVFATD